MMNVTVHAADFLSKDTLNFSGYKWLMKESNNIITGPGFNYFSSDKENVFVDDAGKLHLAVAQRNNRWYCSEVRLAEAMGYGTYSFDIAPNENPLDKNLVNGFFTYDKNDPLNFHKEIDLEISHWGRIDSANSQYVIQPYDEIGHLNRFETNLSLPSHHTIEWCKKKIIFKSYVSLNDTLILFNEWTYKSKKGIAKGDERFCINLWLFKSSAPSNEMKNEVVISNFQFQSDKKKK